MSGMDRLSDDKLKRMAGGLFNALEMQLLDDLGSMARELLAHRRASHAAPAPQKPVAWAETDHKGKVIGVSMNQYPWHPTPLYAQAAPAEEWEACTCGPCPLHPAAPAPSDALREENARLRYVLDGVRVAISTGRNEPLMVWLDQINIALSTPTEERQ